MVLMKPIDRSCWLIFLLLCISWKIQAKPTKDPPLLRSCNMHFTQAIAENPYTIRIPFRLTGRLVTFEARVESVEGLFILDTGAERLLLNKNYFKGGRLLKKKSPYGASGRVNQVRHKTVDTLYWDNLKLDALDAHVVDLSHIEQKRNARIVGILGYEVLKDFEIFLDYPSKQIVLSKLDDQGNRLDKDMFHELPID